MIAVAERLRIQDMTINEPSRQSWITFDQDKFTGPDIHELVKRGLKNSLEAGKVVDYARKAARQLILFPYKRDELLLPENPKSLFTEDPDGNVKINHATNLKILYPKEITEQVLRDKFGITFDLLDQDTDRFINGPHWDPELERIFNAFILFPDKFPQIAKKTELEKALLEARERRRTSSSNDWPELFSKFTLCLKLLNPDKYPQCSQEDWEERDETFMDNDLEFDFDVSESIAANMKLIAAKEIKMTENGLKIMMESDEAPTTKNSQLPVRRRF